MASDVGGIREQIEDGITGFFIPQGNAEEMAKRIIYLLDNDKLRAEIGANAAIAAKYSIAKIHPGDNMEKPVISIVLGSYNRHKFLKETIKSIRSNGITVPYEIIVIDGGSRDGSIEYLTKQPDIITIIQHNRTKIDDKLVMKHSWGYFMNLAFQMSKGKYVLMISDDCLLLPKAVMNGYNLFEKELKNGRKIGALAFYWRDFPEEIKYKVGVTLDDKVYVNHGMYLRDALADVNWIEEDYYRFYCADSDLCLKMWQKNYEVIESPDSYVEHTLHTSNRVRKSNLNNTDRDRYIAKWDGVFHNLSKDSMDRWIEKEHDDSNRTYKTILKISPKIFILYLWKKLHDGR